MFFRRKKKPVNPEAVEAVRCSREMLAETRGQVSEARAVNARMVALRHTNHFGERLEEAYRLRRGHA